jgi:hypothetical protein
MSLQELCDDMNAHCENCNRDEWKMWTTSDFSENEIDFVRDYCGVFEYYIDTPDYIKVNKLCDRCLERWMTYKYTKMEAITKSTSQAKDDEIKDLRERLTALEKILSTLTN